MIIRRFPFVYTFSGTPARGIVLLSFYALCVHNTSTKTQFPVRPFVRIHRNCSFCGEAVTVASQTLVLTNSTSLAPPQAAGLVRSVARPLQIANASLVCNLVPSVLPEKVGKKMRLETRYIARSRARFLFDALFGGRIATVPIAFGSDECTTRSCGQTPLIAFLLISGILGRLRCYTACCRGRGRA